MIATRFRLPIRYALVVAVIAVAGCRSDVATEPTKKMQLGSVRSTWISPQPCQFGSPANPQIPASYPTWGTLVSASASTCNVSWSMYFAYNSIYKGMYGPEYNIEWRPTRRFAMPGMWFLTT